MATTGGLFGNASAANTNTQPTTGLFGASTTQTPSTSSGGLFGASSQQRPTLSSLFGGNTNNSTATPQPQQHQGQTATPTPAGGGGGGLFGNAQAQQKPAGGLFASTSAQPATTNTIGGSGLFAGAAATQQQPAQASAGGLFGASTANTQQTTAASGTSAFGQQQAKPAASLFGQPQPQQQQQQQQHQTQNTIQTIPAVQINYDTLRPRSRFDDLAQPIQDEVALIDKGIQRVIKMRDEIGEFMPKHGEDIEQLGNDVKFVESKFRTVQEALHRDIQTVKTLQDVTKRNIADAQLSFKATDNLKLPSHYHQPGLFAGSAPSSSSSSSAAAAAAAVAASNATGADSDDPAASAHANAQDLISYFNRICDDLERYKRRLDEYRGEIERDMPGVEHGLYEQIRSFRDRSTASSAAAAHGGAAVVQGQLNQVLAALRETGNAIVAQAGQIADTRERLSRLQAGFLDSGLLSAY